MTDKEKPQSNTPENEIRVSGKTPVLRAVERIETAFKTFDHVTISGINSGISKVLLITEIVKLKIADLHQYNQIETITREMHDEDKAKDEENNEAPRYLTRFKVELHKTKQSTPKGAFYEAPYTAEQVKKISEVKAPEGGDRPRTARGGFRGRGFGRGRGRGRGEGRGRGGRDGPRSARGGRREGGRGEGRGRGRGERRGGRGEGRGGRGEGRGTPRGGRGEGRGAPRGGRGGRGGAKKDIEGL